MAFGVRWEHVQLAKRHNSTESHRSKSHRSNREAFIGSASRKQVCFHDADFFCASFLPFLVVEVGDPTANRFGWKQHRGICFSPYGELRERSPALTVDDATRNRSVRIPAVMNTSARSRFKLFRTSTKLLHTNNIFDSHWRTLPHITHVHSFVFLPSCSCDSSATESPLPNCLQRFC